LMMPSDVLKWHTWLGMMLKTSQWCSKHLNSVQASPLAITKPSHISCPIGGQDVGDIVWSGVTASKRQSLRLRLCQALPGSARFAVLRQVCPSLNSKPHSPLNLGFRSDWGAAWQNSIKPWRIMGGIYPLKLQTCCSIRPQLGISCLGVPYGSSCVLKKIWTPFWFKLFSRELDPCSLKSTLI
jgi:hypothetical protein